MSKVLRAILLGGALILTPARAADLDARIHNIDGTPLVDDKGKELTLTVRTVAVNALMAPYPDEPNLSGEEKIRRAALARSIYEKTADHLSAEDVALVKKLVNKFYPSPLVVEQTWTALERESPAPAARGK